MTAKYGLLISLLAILIACGQPNGGTTSSSSAAAPAEAGEIARPGERIDFLEKRTIGDPPSSPPPWIANLAITDLDRDGLTDVVICDATLNQVRLIRQFPAGTFEESNVGAATLAPAHVTPSDIDLDGDIDLLIAEMGQIFPSNEKIGAVDVLENLGEAGFEQHVLVEGVARVTDIEPGDFDGDGDLDLAVGQFGYDDGEIRWMRNDGDWNFVSEQLLSLPGTIHVPVADMDGDGDLDIAAVVAQDWEQIYVFENDGQAGFTSHIVYGATNEDFGSSGISLTDLDQDGDQDILYTNGDAFDHTPPLPRPWHGVQWLENRGGLLFEYHLLAHFPGAYSAKATDIDHDGDLDIFLVSMFADWNDPTSQSIAWLENDGSLAFTIREIDTAPTHLITLDIGDMDADGWDDLVTGGMYSHEPFDRMGRVTWWRNLWAER